MKLQRCREQDPRPIPHAPSKRTGHTVELRFHGHRQHRGLHQMLEGGRHHRGDQRHRPGKRTTVRGRGTRVWVATSDEAGEGCRGRGLRSVPAPDVTDEDDVVARCLSPVAPNRHHCWSERCSHVTGRRWFCTPAAGSGPGAGPTKRCCMTASGTSTPPRAWPSRPSTATCCGATAAGRAAATNTSSSS